MHRALPLRLGFLVGQNVGWVSGGSGAALGASASLALIHAGFTQDVLNPNISLKKVATEVSAQYLLG